MRNLSCGTCHETWTPPPVISRATCQPASRPSDPHWLCISNLSDRRRQPVKRLTGQTRTSFGQSSMSDTRSSSLHNHSGRGVPVRIIESSAACYALWCSGRSGNPVALRVLRSAPVALWALRALRGATQALWALCERTLWAFFTRSTAFRHSLIYSSADPLQFIAYLFILHRSHCILALVHSFIAESTGFWHLFIYPSPNPLQSITYSVNFLPATRLALIHLFFSGQTCPTLLIYSSFIYMAPSRHDAYLIILPRRLGRP